MAEDGKRVEVRMGTFALTIEGYDDPVTKLREVMTLVQQMVSETPALVDLSVDVDTAEVQRALDARSEPVVARKERSGDDVADTGHAGPPDDASDIRIDEFSDDADGGDVVVAEVEEAEVLSVTPGAEGPAPDNAIGRDADEPADEERGAGDMTDGAVAGDPAAGAEPVSAPSGNAVAGSTPPEAAPAGEAPADAAPSDAAPSGSMKPAPVDANRTGNRLYGLGRFAAGVDGARRRRPAEAPPLATGAAEPQGLSPASGATAGPDAAAADETPGIEPDGGAGDAVPETAEGDVSSGIAAEDGAPPMARTAEDGDAADATAEATPAEPAAGRPEPETRAALAGAAFYLRPDRDKPEDVPESTGDDSLPANAPESPLPPETAAWGADQDRAAAVEPPAPTDIDTDTDTDADTDTDMPERSPERSGPSAAFRNIFSPRSPDADDEPDDDDTGSPDIFSPDPDMADATPDARIIDVPPVHEMPLKSADALTSHGPGDRTADETAPGDEAGDGARGGIRYAPDMANIFAKGSAATAGGEAPGRAPADPQPDEQERQDDDVLNIFATDAPDGDPAMPDAPVSGTEMPVSRFGALLDRLRPLGADDSHPVGGDPGDASATGPRDPRAVSFSAADFAKIGGLDTVPDLLIAAAAWLTLARGRVQFSRREIMDVFDGLPGDHPKSLEARIKGYGKLVRSGSFVLVSEGRFMLSRSERDRFASLLP